MAKNKAWIWISVIVIIILIAGGIMFSMDFQFTGLSADQELLDKDGNTVSCNTDQDCISFLRNQGVEDELIQPYLDQITCNKVCEVAQ